MPAPIKVWSDALAAVDRSGTPINKWNYYVPEPGLFMGTKDEERQNRYLTTWLRARQSWYYTLYESPVELVQIPPQWWRDFLNSGSGMIQVSASDTKTAARKKDAMALFGRIFMDVELNPDFRGEIPKFFCRNITLPDLRASRELMWELFEIGFRFELWALDNYFVPSVTPLARHLRDRDFTREHLLTRVFDHQYHSMLVLRLPGSHTDFATERIRDRLANLEAFRTVVCRWPHVPDDIRNGVFASTCTDVLLHDREKKLVQFYVQSFYDVAGRAPLVPHVFPLVEPA